MKKNKELQKIENIMEIEIPIDTKSKEFEKVMFIYKVALKEINTKLEILKDEFKLFYEYDLNIHSFSDFSHSLFLSVLLLLVFL